MGFTNWINDIVEEPKGETITIGPIFPGEEARTIILPKEKFKVGDMLIGFRQMNLGSKIECPNCKTKFNQ